MEPFERESRRGKNHFFSEDIHFNEDGHAVVAEALRVHLSETIETDREEDSP